VIATRGISKHFGTVQALRGADVEVHAGGSRLRRPSPSPGRRLDFYLCDSVLSLCERLIAAATASLAYGAREVPLVARRPYRSAAVREYRILWEGI
jgi:hypothetical protein